MHLDAILDPAELDRMVRENYVSRVVSPDGRYILYNYTPRATYARIWQPETLCCRGLVVDTHGWVVCYPFDKFFNAGETEALSIEKLAEYGGPMEITEKLDGSMIAIWYDGQRWRCTTRGSFVSTQAIAAEAWLYRNVNFDAWPKTDEFTFIAEWCAPDNRIVLKYDRSDLRLIGMRIGLVDQPHAVLSAWGASLGLPVVALVPGDFAALVAQQGTATGVEGWVVRWSPGFRVKVKTIEYLHLHRLITGFSAARVREALLGGALNAYMAELPEEIRPDAERIVSDLNMAAATRVAALQTTYTRLAPLLSESRKAFALAVQQEPSDDRGYLFSIADGKPIERRIIETIDLRALFGDMAEPINIDEP